MRTITAGSTFFDSKPFLFCCPRLRYIEQTGLSFCLYLWFIIHWTFLFELISRLTKLLPSLGIQSVQASHANEGELVANPPSACTFYGHSQDSESIFNTLLNFVNWDPYIDANNSNWWAKASPLSRIHCPVLAHWFLTPYFFPQSFNIFENNELHPIISVG
jgi:hypothetical protein